MFITLAVHAIQHPHIAFLVLPFTVRDHCSTIGFSMNTIAVKLTESNK